MAHTFTTSYLEDSLALFRQYKQLTEKAIGQVTDEQLFVQLDDEANCIAILVKHMAGNMCSRWTDFLTTDGEKPDRNRDMEFAAPPSTRKELMDLWENGWQCVFRALEPLSDRSLLHAPPERQGVAFPPSADARRNWPHPILSVA